MARVILAGLALAVCSGAHAENLLPFSREEIAAILLHGPWPAPLARDASNRVSGQRSAARFGAQLFFDPRLSADGSIACATCHVPEHGWADRRARAAGLAETQRNTRSVLNTRFSRWFGWGGAADSLWAASIRPLFDPREMGNAERHAASRVRESADLACGYRTAFGRPPPADDEALIVDLGKALAAFQETLVTGRTPFDDFRDALARGDRRAAARYPLAAQRGLRLFVGAGRCSVCHVGPRFTNDEFDKIGIPVRDAEGRFDWGRYDGIKAAQASRFNLLSRYNDDRTGARAISTRHVAVSAEAYGAFAVPGLRNVALTAPYMHDGRLATLRDVVRHYSEIDDIKLHLAVPHPHAEPGEPLPPQPTSTILQTLNLSESQIADLIAFLESLTEIRPSRRAPAAGALSCP
jgi:cytochrome c peroxidase